MKCEKPYKYSHLVIYFIHSYPMCPPIVRFLTKIVHPNVSRHGDVGIDIIQHNWSLALTISKLLLSVQSLLTDPFTEVSFLICWCQFELKRSLFPFFHVFVRFVWNRCWAKCMKMIVLNLKHWPDVGRGNMQCMKQYQPKYLLRNYIKYFLLLH